MKISDRSQTDKTKASRIKIRMSGNITFSKTPDIDIVYSAQSAIFRNELMVESECRYSIPMMVPTRSIGSNMSRVEKSVNGR